MTRTAIVAHRGGAALWPENSLTACRGALALGVDGIEVDVHLSADDEVMVVHDPTLDRTCAAEGPVRERTAAALRSVHLLGTHDEHVPTFDEVLELLAPTGAVISVEMKTDVGSDPYPGMAARVIDALDVHGALERAFVHAFDWRYLEELRALRPDLELGGNVDKEALDTFGSWEAVFSALSHIGARDLNGDHRLVDEQVIAEATRRGLGVTLWTVNDDAAMSRFLAARVGVLCTDRPDVALAKRLAFEAAALRSEPIDPVAGAETAAA